MAIKKEDERGASASLALRIANTVADMAIDGVGPLTPAVELAEDYLANEAYEDDDARVDGLIKRESYKNFGTGFVTSFGGAITMPVSLPTALVAGWAVQARMSAAIAHIYGYDVHDERVRTFVMVTLVGDEMVSTLRDAGVRAGKAAARGLISRVPGKLLKEINKRVGFSLLAKGGEKGAVNLMRLVPVLGGAVSGGFDAYTCRKVGQAAKALFGPGEAEQVEETE